MNPLAEHIQRGHTIVCANARLAHHFRHLHAQQQLRAGLRVWERADILPWQAWLRRAHAAVREQGGNAATLLSGAQERLLWEQIIAASRFNQSLLQFSAVAQQAVAAWQLLKEYRIPLLAQGDPRINEDALAFNAWAREYQARCRRNNWTDNASLPDALRAAATAVPEAFDKALTLVGFEQLTAQQNLLCEALGDAGITVHEHQQEARNQTAGVADFADTEAEIRAAALWARQLVEQDEKLTIGILTPELHQLRNRISIIFEDVLAPGNLHYLNGGAPLPFTLATGQALPDYPLTDTVFTVLELLGGRLPLATLSRLLRSPFIKGHAGEADSRALFDKELRSRNRLFFSWNDVIHLARNPYRRADAPILTAMLQELQVLAQGLPEQQSPEAWGRSYTACLELLGWPGERALNSAEYQQINAWNSVLDEFVSVRVVAPQLSGGEALEQLRRIAGAVSFQPETAETPIQILGLQGAAALAFDHIRILGLSEEVWPPRASPNPFIPIALQQCHGVPRADPDMTLAQAQQLQQALINSTPDIVLSHARTEADRPLLRSPLLHDLPDLEAASGPARVFIPYAQTILSSSAMETWQDPVAPAVSGRHAGGSALFKDQSQCPFRAFAIHRLHSRALDRADLGLNAMERGSLAHDLLEMLWSGMDSQAQLAALSEPEREQLLESIINELLETRRKRDPVTFSAGFIAVETQRLKQILRNWVELELGRAPFTEVQTELRVQRELAGLELLLRLDRVDKLEDGRCVIIDYKTGKDDTKKWLDDRPDDPQMPLYAVTHPEPVAALAFARLRRDRHGGFAGLSVDERILPDQAIYQNSKGMPGQRDFPGEFKLPAGAHSSWQKRLSEWRATLEALAGEFCAGVATVTPKRYACQYCDQTALCRINEVNLSLTATGNGDV